MTLKNDSLNFVTLDVETANAFYGSICQIGIVVFKSGEAVESFDFLLNPMTEFKSINNRLHRIDAEAIASAPTFEEIYDKVFSLLHNQVVVHHSPFDKSAMMQAAEKYSLPQIPCSWLDSLRIARRIWGKQTGCGLAELSKYLNLDYTNAHNAVCDAKLCGEVLIKAIEELGIDSLENLSFKTLPREMIKFDEIDIIDDRLIGENIVFTGSFCMVKSDMEILATQHGGTVKPSVTKETTMLIVGDTNLHSLTDDMKSTKHKKAEKLFELGHNIRILTEDDFLNLISESHK